MIDWDTELERIELIKWLRENPKLLHEKIQQLQKGVVVLRAFLMERERRQRLLNKLLDIARRRRAEQL